MHFNKKGDALNFFKEMLNGYGLGDKVSAHDQSVLLLALATHPDAVEKIGVGIDHFTVEKADYNTRCFWANRSDGSSVKFSYKSCVNPK